MKAVKYRDYREALQALQDQFSDQGITICDIFDLGGATDAAIQLSLRWSSAWCMTPADAVEFANCLLDAAMAVKEFLYNGYMIDYDS